MGNEGGAQNRNRVLGTSTVFASAVILEVIFSPTAQAQSPATSHVSVPETILLQSPVTPDASVTYTPDITPPEDTSDINLAAHGGGNMPTAPATTAPQTPSQSALTTENSPTQSPRTDASRTLPVPDSFSNSFSFLAPSSAAPVTTEATKPDSNSSAFPVHSQAVAPLTAAPSATDSPHIGSASPSPTQSAPSISATPTPDKSKSSSDASPSAKPTASDSKSQSVPQNPQAIEVAPFTFLAPAPAPAPAPTAPKTPELIQAPVVHFAKPIVYPGATCTSKIGMRQIGNGAPEMHNGYDIAAPLGTDIHSVTDGVVLYSRAAQGYGYWIVIKSADGLVVTYGHMKQQDLLVKAGDTVTAGQIISKVGSEGQATGPHLHLQFNQGAWNGPVVNPEDLLRKHGIELCDFSAAPKNSPIAPPPKPSPAPPSPSSAPATSVSSPDKVSHSSAAPTMQAIEINPFTFSAPAATQPAAGGAIEIDPFTFSAPNSPIDGPSSSQNLAPQAEPNLNKQQQQIIDSLNISNEKKQFISQAMAAAMELRKEGNILNPAVMVAQACMESGFGQHLPPNSFNYFGLKATPDTPPDQKVLAWTSEQNPDGSFVRIQAYFMKFRDMKEGLRAQLKFFQDRWWFNDALTIKDASDDQAFLDDIFDDGNLKYATELDYKTNLINLYISPYKLDEIVRAGTS